LLERRSTLSRFAGNLPVSAAIGVASFLLPFAGGFAFALVVLGWPANSSAIAGIALSTMSVGVVHAAMIETGLAGAALGRLILAPCFMTDLGTVLALGLVFANVSPLLLGFGAALALACLGLPAVATRLIQAVPDRVSEPEVKLLLAVVLLLGGLAVAAGSEAVLPAYVLGLAAAPVFLRDRAVLLPCARRPSPPDTVLLRLRRSLDHGSRDHRQCVGHPRLARPEGRHQDGRRVADGEALRNGPARRSLHHPHDVNGADLRNHQRAVWIDSRRHRSGPVHRAGLRGGR
jgi:hypothetical protein